MRATASRGLLGMALVMVMVLALAGVLVVPKLGQEITLRFHATDKHGWSAVEARSWLATAGPENRFQCDDGRDRVIVPAGPGRWALGVWEAGVELTSFITEDRDYVRRQAERCGASGRDLGRLKLSW